MSNPDIEARLAELKQAYMASLAAKHLSLVTLWAGLCTQWTSVGFDELYRLVHSLAGSAETFGFADITQAARAVVDDFRMLDKKQPSQTQQARLEQKLAALLVLLQKHGS